MSFPRTRELRWVAVLTFTMWGTCGHAAGLGAIEVRSGLGQPLRVSIPLLGDDVADHGSGCIRAKVESLDGALLISPGIALTRSAQSASILLSTRRGINEPVLNVSVGIGCAVSMQRDYQVLLDPVETLPALQESTPAAPLQAARASAQPDVSGKRRIRASRPAHRGAAAAKAPSRKAHPHAVAHRRRAERSVLKMSRADAPAADASAVLRLKSSDTLSAAGAIPEPKQLPELRAERARAIALLGDEVPAEDLQALIRKLQAERDTLRAETDRLRQPAPPDHAPALSAPGGAPNMTRELAALLAVSLAVIGWLLWRIHAMRQNASRTSWNELLAETTVSARTDDNTVFSASAFETTGLGAYSPPCSYTHSSRAPSATAKADEISDVMELVDAWMAIHDTGKVLEILEPFRDAEHPQSPLP